MTIHTEHTAFQQAAFARNPLTREGGLSRQACSVSSGKRLAGEAVLCGTPPFVADASGRYQPATARTPNAAAWTASSTTKRQRAMKPPVHVHKRPLFLYGLLILLLMGAAACGGSDTPPDNTSSAAPTGQDGLSEAQLENGIGPITQIDLPAAIDAAKVAQGEEIFTTKCAICHKLDERFTAPPLGDVLSRRTPEFVMNMMLNPDEMVQKHPEVKAMLAEYFVPMPNQNVTEDEARAVLEYLRDNQTETTDAAQ